jgi:hypothetical protein
LSIVKTPRSTTLRSAGQAFAGSFCGIAGRGELRLQVEGHRPALQMLRQFLHQEIRRSLGRIGRLKMNHVLGHQLIAYRLSRARFVDEHERIDAIISSLAKRSGVATVAKAAGTEG